jgi:hypothetical protein
MNGKDIALTTGGILATMALAYLLYRIQQRDAAAAIAASTQAQAEEAAAASAGDAYNNQQASLGVYAALPQLLSPVITGTTTNVAAAEPTSIKVADLGLNFDSTDINHLLSDIVAAHPTIVASTSHPAALDLMAIPAVSGVNTSSALGGIPVTAEEAAAQAIAATPSYLAPTTGNQYNSIRPGMIQVGYMGDSSASSHRVEAHPILQIGAA